MAKRTPKRRSGGKSTAAQPQTVVPPGRPSTFTPEVGDRICALIAEGKTTREICKGDDMPHPRTLFRWLRVHATFRQQYTLAREVMVEELIQETVGIADAVDASGPMGVGSAMVQKAKLRIDTRKWWASKVLPRKYGDGKHGAGGPGDGDKPVRKLIEISVKDVHPDDLKHMHRIPGFLPGVTNITAADGTEVIPADDAEDEGAD